ncbi:ski oncogene-like [Arctopsyche grandis]|uniref:ski oncogene-like n=1 Tax=Arctopsyche grandis TaxID=121162 RepID=UPI00406D706E
MDAVTPHLETVLKSYQHSATRSLHGPGPALATDSPPPTQPPPAPPAPLSPCAPLLSAPDRGRGERGETLLEGEPISCFLVGGEKRLCLPQILTSVLTDFSLEQINRICDELQIYCSRCTAEQLHELKATGVLPRSAPSCGLITKTNAQRLCGALLHRAAPPPPAPPPPAALRFRVYHECFGVCSGVCVPALYTEGRAPCIQCSECRGLFSPQRFVCHAHRDLEHRTCHWGFDADNWRAYLLVAEDQPDRDRLSAVLDDLQRRYRRDFPLQPASAHSEAPAPRHPDTPVTPKRKVVTDPVCKLEPLDVPLKKPKMEDFYTYVYAMEPYIQFQAAALYDQYNRALSAFRPWPNKRPFLSREPPLLQHPEKVVHLKDTSRFERTFQPNVALKPQHPPTPPSSDEITSSTSPPPGPDVPTSAPPPDCELSTDTDEEDVKDLLVDPSLDASPAKDSQPHIRKSYRVKENKIIQQMESIKEDEFNSHKENSRLLEELRKKDSLIEKQAAVIQEKDALIATLYIEMELLKEKQALTSRSEQSVSEEEIKVEKSISNQDVSVVNKKIDICLPVDTVERQIEVLNESEPSSSDRIDKESSEQVQSISVVDIKNTNSDQIDECEIPLESQQGCENDDTDSIKWECQ